MSGKESKSIIILSFLTNLCFIIFIASISSSFSLENYEYTFKSDVYNITDKYIENISPYTSKELFSNYFDMKNCTIDITYNNEKIDNKSYIPNGSITNIYNDKNEIIKTYTNVIKGDYTEDGIINEIDLQKIGKCLVDKCILKDYELKSLDIDKDNELHLNDLLLLDKTINRGYQNITLNKESITLRLHEKTRLIATVTPNYGLNTNVKWSSLNPNIVTVDDTGRIYASGGGETKIQAKTQDDKLLAETKITVDNSIILEKYESEGYINGDPEKIHIDVLNYEGLTCTSSNPEKTSCSIEGEYLIMDSIQTGPVEITVKGPKYKDVIYKLDNAIAYLNSLIKAGCNLNSPFRFNRHYKKELLYISDNPEVVKGAHTVEYDGITYLVVDYGPKAGRATLTVKASTADASTQILLDHSFLRLSEIYRFMKVGEEIVIDITGENLGELSCESDQNSKYKDIVECRVENNKLIVKALALGEVDVHVYNTFTYEGGWDGDCGKTPFSVFVTEE